MLLRKLIIALSISFVVLIGIILVLLLEPTPGDQVASPEEPELTEPEAEIVGNA